MNSGGIKIPTIIKVMSFLKRSPVCFNLLSITILTASTIFSVLINNFSLLSSGGALVALISTLFLLSYSVPTSGESYLNFLKLTKPLDHEVGRLAELTYDAAQKRAESDRIAEGNLQLSAQASYILWTVVGTLIGIYSPYFNKFLIAFCAGYVPA